MKTLSIDGHDGFIDVDALWLASETLPNIECLKLSSIKASVPDVIGHFENLTFLSVTYCESIINDHIKTISTGKLRKLKLDNCKNISQCFESISNISQLEELVFIDIKSETDDESQISTDYCKSTVVKLTHLVALDLLGIIDMLDTWRAVSYTHLTLPTICSV